MPSTRSGIRALIKLVARSRDIIRKDGWASKVVDEWVCNAIGTGIKPQSMHPKLVVKEKLQALCGRCGQTTRTPPE